MSRERDGPHLIAVCYGVVHALVIATVFIASLLFIAGMWLAVL